MSLQHSGSCQIYMRLKASNSYLANHMWNNLNEEINERISATRGIHWNQNPRRSDISWLKISNDHDSLCPRLSHEIHFLILTLMWYHCNSPIIILRVNWITRCVLLASRNAKKRFIFIFTRKYSTDQFGGTVIRLSCFLYQSWVTVH